VWLVYFRCFKCFSPKEPKKVFELKQRRRRRRAQRLVKNQFIFYRRNSQLLDLFTTPMALGKCSDKYAMTAFISKMEIRNISRRRSRSSDYAKLGHFTLLFCRGRQRNVKRFITHVHSCCFAH